MILFLGDIHGSVRHLCWAVDTAKTNPEVTAIIQVGDFGFYPQILSYLQEVKPHIPVYAIDGNHEHFPMISHLTEVTEMAPNIFYVPRGTVMEIDGRKIGFIGGAGSVDKQYRLKRKLSWFPEEEVTEDDIKKFDGINKLDILVTHTPPHRTVQRNFSPLNLLQFDLPVTWTDPSAKRIGKLWERLGRPKLICGHMHKSVSDENVLILDINQIHVM